MRLRSVVPLLLLLGAGCALRADGGAAPVPPSRDASWAEVEKALDEQRLAEALAAIERLEASARRAGDDAELARALVRSTRVRIALGGYETAARALLAADWPRSGLPRADVALQAAHALRAYLDAYRWEIASRERVSEDAGTPLREWTLERIANRIDELYAAADREREALGALPPSAFESLEPNEYPDAVRPTARDAVTYLRVAHLADAGLWPAEEASRLRALPIDALLEADPESDTSHPLARAAALLAGLERWHGDRGETAAALEARLERYAAVHAVLESPARRREVRERLGASLEAFEADPWWSMARVRLAAMVREEARPEALAEARDLVAEGERRHPGSPGAAACRALRQELEAPFYGLGAMRVDGPRRRSVEIRHRNLPRLHLRAYGRSQLTVEAAFGRGEGWTDERIDAILASRPVAEWTVELPPTPDLREHRSYVTPPLDEPGRYVLLVAAGPSFRREDGIRQAIELELSDLVLLAHVERGDSPAAAVTTLSGTTGDPIPGARVTVYRSSRRDRPEAVASALTDATGFARVPIGDPADERRGWAVVARHGDDEAIWGPFYGHYRPAPAGDARRRALLFTDRAIYRPGQAVLFKALLFSGDAGAGRLRALAGAATELRLRDPNGDVVERRALTTNDFGSASGEVTIAPGRRLGTWRLETDEASIALRVEEYRRPTFEVTLEAPAGEPALGDRVTVGGLAETYFGRPLTGASVRWRVERRPFRPVGPWGDFRAPWPPPGPAEVVASGVSATGADGRFELTFDADAGDAPEGAAVPFAVSVSATDPGGETRDAERLVPLGVAGVALVADDTPFVLEPGASPELALTRRAGEAPRSGRSTWTLLALRAPARPALPAELPDEVDPLLAGAATEGDRLRPRWAGLPAPERIVAGWENAAPVGSGALEHGEDGRALWHPGTLAPGAYRIVFRSADARGREASLERPLLVLPSGADAPLALDLRFVEPTVRIGGTARLELRSGFAGQAVAVEVVRGERVRERRLWIAGRDPSTIELPIGPDDRGGLGVRATLVRDHQRVDATARLDVPWDDRELAVELESFRDRLEPGERTRIRLRVRDASGRPVEEGGAELVAAIVDRSLDLFARLEWPRAGSLYPVHGVPPPWDANLGAGGTVWWGWSDAWSVEPFPGFLPDRPAAIDPYGIGGPGPRGGPRVFRRMATAAPADAREMQAEAVSESLAQDEPAAETPVEIRDEFSETALWAPHLVTGPDGGVAVEVEMPDSLTAWTFRAAAWTRDLAGGLVERELTTARDLVVRPYLPRFVREGDRAEIRVVVESSADQPLAGELRFAVVDPASGDDLSAAFGLEEGGSRPFSLAPRGSAELRFAVTAPQRLDEVSVRVEARAGGRSDGELRPLPVLPARMRLTRSRFVALDGAERRVLAFEGLREAEPGRIDEQLVVTVDAQLVESVLAALPYLVDYPYECTEQTMNRFFATAVLDRLFERSPELVRAAREIAEERATELERFEAPDPNRAITLEETPWRVAAGGGRDDAAVRRILDPAVARAVRDEALARLEAAQLPSGAFPWFPGGPPSPYMTLYLMAGFARAAELGAEIPVDVVRRGWSYLAGEIERDWWRRAIDGDCCWELLTAVNFVAGSYADPDLVGELLPADRRREILDFSFRHWRRHPPRLKLQLAVTLARAGRVADARTVLESVFDSARSDRDLGLHWTPEERAWLWYNDDVETHAEALRALLAVAPDDPRADRLVQWLFLQKKLGHWKSTRATAEVLASLVAWLEAREGLGAVQEIEVTAGGETVGLRFEPGGRPDRRRQVVVPGDRIAPRRDAEVVVVVEQSTPGLAFASATWRFTTDRLPEAADGDLLSVRRSYFMRRFEAGRPTLEPLAEGTALAVGDEVEVRLSLAARAPAEYLHLRDPRPAGLEPESPRSGWRWESGLPLYEETRDSGTSFFLEQMPAGEVTLRYRLRAAVAGSFRAAPAELGSIYAPEFAAHSAGELVTVRPERPGQSSK